MGALRRRQQTDPNRDGLGQNVSSTSYAVTFTLPRNPAGQITARNATVAEYDYDPTARVDNATYDG